MSGTNVGQLNVGIGMSTEQLVADGKVAESNVDALTKRLQARAGAIQFGGKLITPEMAAKDAEHLKWSIMTEKERFAVRKQADLDHLAMLLRFKAITDDDFQKLSAQAGRLGLGNIPGDNNMRNTGFRGAMIAQQLGFGVQDFMSQMTNAKTAAEGMGRGIMALSNNVQMMGAAWGGTALAITAIGGALAGIILPSMIKWVLNAEQLERNLKSSEDRLKSMLELAKAVSEAEVKGSTESKRQQLEDEIEIADKTRAKLEGDTMSAINKLRELKKKEKEGVWEIVPGFGVTVGPGTMTGGRNEIEQAVQVQEAKVKQLQGAAEEAMRTAANARQQLQAIGPSTTAGNVGALKDELKVQHDIAKINSESSRDSLISKGKELGERKKMLLQEMDTIRNLMAGKSEDEKRVLERELKDREEAYKKNDKTIAETRAAINKAVAEKELEDAEKERKKKEIKELDRLKLEENKKQAALREEIESLNKLGITPNGPSAMSVAGTSGAASAINRALAGNRSEESDRKRQIKIAEDQLKSSQRIEQKLDFKRAELNAA